VTSSAAAEITALRERTEQALRDVTEASVVIAVYEQAASRGIYAPDDVAKLIDRDRLVTDEHGQALNVSELLDELLAAHSLWTDMGHYERAKRRAEAARQPVVFRGEYRRKLQRMQARYG
jgi:hypothetical protein